MANVSSKEKNLACIKESEPIAETAPLLPNRTKNQDGQKQFLHGYWNFATKSCDLMAQTAFSTVASLFSSLYTDKSATFPPVSPAFQVPDSGFNENTSSGRGRLSSHSRVPSFRVLNSKNLSMILENPYNTVRGRNTNTTTSMAAVRSLLTIMPFKHEEDGNELEFCDDVSLHKNNKVFQFTAAKELPLNDSLASVFADSRSRPRRLQPSSAETASQIAEGTVRALRDMYLDEALELQQALRFWTERWEKPVLSWLEAGPRVWSSPGGYDHRVVGNKVSEIQAVLARRCASIGDLQQHLLRAGWQRGVAQWGVLGFGGQWAAVAGFDGKLDNELSPRNDSYSHFLSSQSLENEGSQKFSSEEKCDSVFDSPLGRQSSEIGVRDVETTDGTGNATANIFVRRKDGGGLFVDDPAFLAQWSVEAIAIVRRQLTQAANGLITIPFNSNWKKRSKKRYEEDDLILDDGDENTLLPLWADITSSTSENNVANMSDDVQSKLTISNLPLMCEEVSELLTAMEELVGIQRQRRLEKLRPPGWLRRNWYFLALSGPPVAFFLHQMIRRDYARKIILLAIQKVVQFYRDRVEEPIVAIVKKIWVGRESFSDQKARMEAIESLKKMIKSWLDDTFPNMPQKKRIELSEAMDVTLLEQQKPEAMKMFFEVNNVIRMSFIEMQYMKKELLNALNAMDEMMSANDINMYLAATTPVILLAYLHLRFFHFLYYALLKLGHSREETYASFRKTLTDIERLLVMRDNPPQSPPPSSGMRRLSGIHLQQTQPTYNARRVLGPGDLGMLMLLIHDCKNLLWRDKRRFTKEMTLEVAEDLAELAGERGAVSVQQQLKIISRMSRTYPFLKVNSVKHFQHSQLWNPALS